MKSIRLFTLVGLFLSPSIATSSDYGLVWSNCSSADPLGLSCGIMQVPLNWADSREGNISLGITRLKSADPTHRIGNLFLNFGGPGASAAAWINRTADGTREYFTPTLLKHFDLIGLDPRGVGISSPIKCDPVLWNERPTWFPSTEEDFNKMVARNKAIGESCLNLTGPLLGHIDTTSAALDMEALRLALNDGKLSFAGFSYGSQLGTQYAELFPNSFRALVLDGNLDHSQTETNMFTAEGTTAQDVFERFAAWCTTTSTCALYGQDVPAVWDSLIAKAAAEPIPAPGCLEVGSSCRPDVTAEDILFQL